MKTYVDKETFVNTFDLFGRGNNFSRAAREALFEYFEELERDLGEEIEFDCIAICCDWSEYGSAVDWAHDYHSSDQWAEYDWSDYTDEGIEEFWLDHLRDNTQVIEFDGGILVRAF